MRRILRLTVPAVIVLLTLVLSALWATPALADDGTPPNTAPAGVSAPASAASSSTDAAPAPAAAAPADVSAPASAAPSSADPAPAPAAAAPADVSAPASAAPSSTDPAPAPAAAAPADVSAPASNTVSNPASLLAQVPKGTRFVVTDASGKAISLASQKAAQAVVKGDPTWCPTGVNPGGAGCSGPQSSFNALLGYMSNKTVAGTIWIETSYDSSIGDSGGVNIDGSLLGLTENYALTLKGGWTGSGATINIAAPSTFNVPLSINWNAAVTLSDIVITGLSDAGSTALTITTPANITLTRVNVNTNAGSGAYIDNTAGTGAVTVSNSNFSSNSGGEGLDIFSNGVITLNSVTASNNFDGGAFLDNNQPGTQAGITINNTATNTFSSNGDDGLDVLSNGAITLTNIIANSNGTLQDPTYTNGYGAFVENDQSAASPQIVSILGTNQFNSNWLDGLYVGSYGTITLNGTTASSNGNTYFGGDGAYLDNCRFDTVNNVCATVTPEAVNVTGTNIFSNNYDNGLVVFSLGAITVNSATADSNGSTGFPGGDGAYLNNCNNLSANTTACTTVTPMAVTITGTNTFNSNYADGLNVTSLGVVTLNNITANLNGAATLDPNNITLGYPVGYGVEVFNAYSTKSPKSVSVLGANQFMDNWLDGLNVGSYGTITLNSALAASNGGGKYDGYGYGASLDNCQYDNGCTAVTPMAVNLTGNNAFSANYDSGLFVQSKGAITVNNVNAVANGLANGRDGAYLDNDFTGAVGGVSVTNTAAYSPSFNGNGYDGLEVYSLGTITVMDLDAQNNGNDGVYLENDYAGAVNVSLGTARAGWVNSLSDNGFDGLAVFSKGLVTLANIDAENNGYYDSSIYQPVGDGAYVNNTKSPTFLGVTLTGTNTFDNNYLNGLEIYSNGAITLNSVAADNNGYYVGVDTGNPDTSYLSYGYGAWLDNRNSPALLGVTITGTNSFDGNFLSGLRFPPKAPSR